MTTRTLTAAILLTLCLALLVGWAALAATPSTAGARHGIDRPGSGRYALPESTATRAAYPEPERDAYPAPVYDMGLPPYPPPYTPMAYPPPVLELPTPAPVPTCPDAANPDCG